jgi:hypothetical protein
LPPAAAEYYFDRHIIFEISRSEISKMMCLSKDNLARSAIKNLFTQPRVPGSPARCLIGREIVRRLDFLTLQIN